MSRSAKLPLFLAVTAMAMTAATAASAQLKEVPLTDVKLSDDFWSPRLTKNRTVTIPHNLRLCEETGRIANFARAGKLEDGPHQGIYFNDSDVYKVMEAAAYALMTQPDPKLEKYLDDLIAKIAAAQQTDGYLYTFYTLKGTLDKRFTNLKDHHELYCGGHMIEAAVAHYQATKKRNFLDVAIKFADLLDATFGEGKRHDVDGHEEIELALFKLADATGDEKNRKLGEFFVRERGRGTGRKLYGVYYQDHKPTTQASEAVGHAVRQAYLLCAMTDMCLHGDAQQKPALDKIWRDIVERKMYITGGIGAKHEGEAFGDAYDLPNESAYAETCAGIGNALWNQRMHLLTGEGKYADVLEQVTYNGFLSGINLAGDKFFYVNPLASRGKHHRLPWYDCACCPPNVARFLATVPQRAYTVSTAAPTPVQSAAQRSAGPAPAALTPAIHVNLYAAGDATIALPSGKVRIKQTTRYPWDGNVKFTVTPEQVKDFALKLRIPQWCQGATVSINGKSLGELVNDKGYVTIDGAWTAGDVVELNLPMPVRRAKADPRVKANVGRVALQRGPIVYCVEAVDNNGRAMNLALPPDAELFAEHRGQLLGGVTVIKGKALARQKENEPPKTVEFTAVPYYAWDNRDGGANAGAGGEMVVWLPEDVSLAEAIPTPTLASTSKASASHKGERDALEALNDGGDPGSSARTNIPRFTWWPHKGTAEWVQYDFPRPAEVSAVEVYWFDDEPHGGGCRVPGSWTLSYRDGSTWKPVDVIGDAPAVKKDAFNKLAFEPVTADALRLDAKLRDGYSGGILEWRVK
jgi:hypothetical protein